MGLFDWLKKEKSNVQIEDDRIWLTKQAKLQGISSDITEALADSNGPLAILVVAHFPSLAQELRVLVSQGGFDDQRVLVVIAEDLASHSTIDADAANTRQFERECPWGRALVGRPSFIGNAGLNKLADFAESQWIKMVVAERHPLPSHDAASITFARNVPCRFRIVHHVSLDEPLMRLFAGEWVRQFLERLGMSEGEAIKSRMVARRILEAQKKIDRRATSDMPADSAEEWFERNCPM